MNEPAAVNAACGCECGLRPMNDLAAPNMNEADAYFFRDLALFYLQSFLKIENGNFYLQRPCEAFFL